jgi:hypothetical protein
LIFCPWQCKLHEVMLLNKITTSANIVSNSTEPDEELEQAQRLF